MQLFKSVTIVCVSLLLLSVSGTSQFVSNIPISRHSFVVIAHRGDHTQVPENTLQAYRNAINSGADYVEIDLRTSKDSQLVIMHDANLMRMTGLNAAISSLSYDSIRLLKVRDTTHINQGYFSIPSFKEVLQLCKNKINIYLDFKDASAAAAMKEIREAGMEKNFIVYINTMKQLADWQNIATEIPLMVSLPSLVRNREQVKSFLKKYPVSILDGNYNEYSIEMVQAAAEMKVPVWPDILSEKEQENWEKAILLGIQALQTDHPEALIAYLKGKGLR